MHRKKCYDVALTYGVVLRPVHDFGWIIYLLTGCPIQTEDQNDRRGSSYLSIVILHRNAIQLLSENDKMKLCVLVLYQI